MHFHSILTPISLAIIATLILQVTANATLPECKVLCTHVNVGDCHWLQALTWYASYGSGDGLNLKVHSFEKDLARHRKLMGDPTELETIVYSPSQVFATVPDPKLINHLNANKFYFLYQLTTSTIGDNQIKYVYMAPMEKHSHSVFCRMMDEDFYRRLTGVFIAGV